MIALKDIVVDEGRFKKVYTVLEENEYCCVCTDGLHAGIRVETEDLTDVESREIWEAIRNLNPFPSQMPKEKE